MLEGKVALVTGGSRGIGRAIAKRLAKEGAMVIVNYAGSREQAEGCVREITEAGGVAETVQCDVSDFDACGEMMKEILKRHGKLDILVNNAGITRDGLVLAMSEADYDDVLDINLKGAFNTIRHSSKAFLRQRSGRIINISSVSGILGNPGQANYCAAKAGMIGLTKSVARELASRGVCVNAVAPGFIDTDMTKELQEKAREALQERIPLGRIGAAQDVAEAVAFLAGEEAGYITGQVLCVDGGMAI
ncbi:MAG: 3-oxoacyl-[acyl-carrier-protein] reductase [Lachnospiraceae bacterium]|nr:3-oxoacyl-[acyl-carrier-protein] reductase [Lachnospiraceae bacterium]